VEKSVTYKDCYLYNQIAGENLMLRKDLDA